MDSNPLVAGMVGLVTASSIYIWQTDRFNKPQKTLLLLCFVFPPLQWVMILIVQYYNQIQYKKSKEFKKEVLNYNEEKKIDNSKTTLQELKDSGIITEEEYKTKVEKIDSQKSELAILNSKEYAQLKSLLDSNILTKEEFENKLVLLKSKISNKTDNPSNKNYRIVDVYSEGLALVIDDNLEYGFINYDGEVIIDFIFEHAENFSNGIAKVRIDGEFKNIDYNGNTVL